MNIDLIAAWLLRKFASEAILSAGYDRAGKRGQIKRVPGNPYIAMITLAYPPAYGISVWNRIESTREVISVFWMLLRHTLLFKIKSAWYFRPRYVARFIANRKLEKQLKKRCN